jgi:hypothetical protein
MARAAPEANFGWTVLPLDDGKLNGLVKGKLATLISVLQFSRSPSFVLTIIDQEPFKMFNR